MSEKIHADVLLSFLEYRALYREPIFDFLKLYGEVALSVFRAFRQWNVSLDNVTFKQNPLNFSEISTTFALLGGRAAFSVGLGASTLVVTNPSWSEAELIANIVREAVSAVQHVTGVVIEKQKVSIAMHLKPATGTIKDCVSNFMRFEAPKLSSNDLRAYGVSLYREDSTWLVDASVSYPDAMFVRIDRTSGSEVPLEQIAKQLNDDESKLLDLLSLEVE